MGALNDLFSIHDMINEPIYKGVLQSDLDFAGHNPINLTGWPPAGGGGSGSGPFIVITDAPYNAVGNDSTNNTAAIQAAIDAAAAAGGGQVIIPAGIFKTGPLTFPKTVMIAGVSEYASILKANSAGVLLTYFGTDLFDFSDYFNHLGGPTLYNLTLEGANVGTDGVLYTEMSYGMFRDVFVKNFTGKGFRIEGGVFCRIDNCRAHHCAYGFYYKQVNPSTVYGPGNPLPSSLNVIQNSQAFFNTVRGIHYQEGDGLMIVECDLESNGTVGNAASGAVYVSMGINYATTGLIMDRCWVEANVGGSHLEIANTGYNLLHTVSNTTFADFDVGALSHAIILGGGGAGINELHVNQSGAMPARALARDIQGTGANAILTKGPGYYFTETGTFGLTANPTYIGRDARLTPISGGAKLEARNTGTGTWAEVDRWTNP
jgi:hypothetical protein